MKPTNEEINRGIAEFMGLTLYSEETEIMPQCMSHVKINHLRYTTSLDAMVPVFEKLNTEVHYSVINDITNCIARDIIDQEFNTQEAAARAAYAAIMALKEEVE